MLACATHAALLVPCSMLHGVLLPGQLNETMYRSEPVPRKVILRCC